MRRLRRGRENHKADDKQYRISVVNVIEIFALVPHVLPRSTRVRYIGGKSKYYVVYLFSSTPTPSPGPSPHPLIPSSPSLPSSIPHPLPSSIPIPLHTHSTPPHCSFSPSLTTMNSTAIMFLRQRGCCLLSWTRSVNLHVRDHSDS